MAAAGKRELDGRIVFIGLTTVVVAYTIGEGVKNHDVANALGKIEGEADLRIFLFVAFAEDLNDGFRDRLAHGILLCRFLTKNRNIGAFGRAVREENVDIRVMDTAAVSSLIVRCNN